MSGAADDQKQEKTLNPVRMTLTGRDDGWNKIITVRQWIYRRLSWIESCTIDVIGRSANIVAHGVRCGREAVTGRCVRAHISSVTWIAVFHPQKKIIWIKFKIPSWKCRRLTLPCNWKPIDRMMRAVDCQRRSCRVKSRPVAASAGPCGSAPRPPPSLAVSSTSDRIWRLQFNKKIFKNLIQNLSTLT